MTIERRNVGKRLSDLVINRASGTAYLAGQVADDPKADITGQTQQVLAQIDDLLFEAGTDKSKILSATIYLPDMGDFARDERRVGKMGRAGRDAGPRHRRRRSSPRPSTRSKSRSSPRSRFRPDARHASTRPMTSPDNASPPTAATEKPSAAFHRRDLVAARGRLDGHARRVAAGDARDVRRGDGAVLRAGAVPARPRRRLARVGPGGPDVHRLRRRRRGHRARSLPPGDGQGADRAGRPDLARLQLVHQRARAAAREAAHRRDVRRARVLLQLGRRGQRSGAEARPPLRARPLRPAQDPRDLDAQRVSRPHAVHGHRRRPGQVRHRLRPQPDGLHPHPVQRRRRRSKRRSRKKAATTSAR